MVNWTVMALVTIVNIVTVVTVVTVETQEYKRTIIFDNSDSNDCITGHRIQII